MSSPAYFNSSLAKGLAILEKIAAHNGTLTLTEIARSLGMDKSTTKRFLSTLIDLGYVHLEPAGKTYAVSLRTLKLGYSSLSGLAWRDIAKTHLEELHNDVQETVSASTLDGDHILYVVRFTKPGFHIHGAIGLRLPAYISAMGKILMAMIEPADVRQRLVQGIDMRPLTHYTHRSPDSLLADLEECRKRGYAIANQEFSEYARSIGVPIMFRNRSIAAFNVAVNVESYTVDRMVEEILPRMLVCAERISKALDRMEYEHLG